MIQSLRQLLQRQTLKERAILRVEEIFSNLPELTTERLILRKMTLADTEDRYRFLSDEQVIRFLPFEAHQSLEETEAGLRHYIELYEKGQVSPWGIVDKATNRLIGTIGFTTWSPKHGRAELFYYIAREYWGKGLTFEAAREVAQFGFTKMELNRLEATVNPDNRASQRVMEKLGMTREGLLRESYNIHGVYCDSFIYAVLRKDWQY